MQGEAEGSPKGERGRIERKDQKVDECDDSSVEKHVNEMPGERMWAEEMVLGSVEEWL